MNKVNYHFIKNYIHQTYHIQNYTNAHSRIKHLLKIENMHKYRKVNNYLPFLYGLGNMTVRLKGKHLYLIFAEYATVAKTEIKRKIRFSKYTIVQVYKYKFISLFILIK